MAAFGLPWQERTSAFTLLLTLSVVSQSQNTSEALTTGLRGAMAVP
jgi:hypothetical protein